MIRQRLLLATALATGLATGLSTGLLTGLSSAPAAAQDNAISQPGAFEETRVIDELDDATLRAVLTQLSASATPLDEEATTLRIAFPNGVIAIARRMACTGPDACKGLVLTAYLPVPQGMPASRAEETREQFALESLISSVVVNQLGEHVVKTYVILDGGITLANLAIWIGLFSESARAYQESLYASAP